MNTLGVLAGVGIIICASLVRATGDDPAAAAKAFYDAREAGFVNGLLDAIAKDVRG